MPIRTNAGDIDATTCLTLHVDHKSSLVPVNVIAFVFTFLVSMMAGKSQLRKENHYHCRLFCHCYQYYQQFVWGNLARFLSLTWLLKFCGLGLVSLPYHHHSFHNSLCGTLHDFSQEHSISSHLHEHTSSSLQAFSLNCKSLAS